MRHLIYVISPLGPLTLSAALLCGCANPNRVVEYDSTFAPTTVDPQAYDVLVASAIYRPQSGLALGAGDHFGDIVHQEYNKIAHERLAIGRPDSKTARSND